MCAGIYNQTENIITELEPGGNVSWQHILNVTTGKGTINGTAGGWINGADYEIIPAGKDFVMSFKRNSFNSGIGMIGVNKFYTNHHYQTHDFTFYFNSTTIYNFESGGSFGILGYSNNNNEIYYIKRVSGVISYYKGNILLRVSPTLYNGSLILDHCIYSIGFNSIKTIIY